MPENTSSRTSVVNVWCPDDCTPVVREGLTSLSRALDLRCHGGAIDLDDLATRLAASAGTTAQRFVVFHDSPVDVAQSVLVTDGPLSGNVGQAMRDWERRMDRLLSLYKGARNRLMLLSAETLRQDGARWAEAVYRFCDQSDEVPAQMPASAPRDPQAMLLAGALVQAAPAAVRVLERLEATSLPVIGFEPDRIFAPTALVLANDQRALAIQAAIAQAQEQAHHEGEVALQAARAAAMTEQARLRDDLVVQTDARQAAEMRLAEEARVRAEMEVMLESQVQDNAQALGLLEQKNRLDLEAAEAKLRLAEQQLVEARTGREQDQRHATRAREVAAAKIAGLDHDAAQLKDRLVQLQAETEEKTAQLAAHRAENDQQARRLVVVEADLARRIDEIQALTRDIKARDDRTTALTDDLHNQQAETEEKTVQLAARRAENHQQARRLVVVEADLARRTDEIHALTRDIKQRDDRTTALATDLYNHQAEVAALRGSTSWRITAPLRAIILGLRRLRGR